MRRIMAEAPVRTVVPVQIINEENHSNQEKRKRRDHRHHHCLPHPPRSPHCHHLPSRHPLPPLSHPHCRNICYSRSLMSLFIEHRNAKDQQTVATGRGKKECDSRNDSRHVQRQKNDTKVARNPRYHPKINGGPESTTTRAKTYL